MSQMSEEILESNLGDVPLWHCGKVRDVYDLDDRLLIVATDRISAYGGAVARSEAQRVWVGSGIR